MKHFLTLMGNQWMQDSTDIYVYCVYMLYELEREMVLDLVYLHWLLCAFEMFTLVHWALNEWNHVQNIASDMRCVHIK